MFKNKTVDSILSVFTKTIKELEAHSAESFVTAANLRVQAEKLYVAEAASFKEGHKAREVAEKIKGIFGGSES